MSVNRPKTVIDNKARRSVGWRAARWLITLAAVLVICISILSGLYKYLSMESIANYYDHINDFIVSHYVIAVAVYIGLYVIAITLIFPGALWLAVYGGMLFGWHVGSLASIVGATIGSIIIFQIGRMWRSSDTPPANAFNYLLAVRLIPIVPFGTLLFALCSVIAGLFGVRFRIFVTATSLGITPRMVLGALFGTGLNSYLKACAANKSSDLCLMNFNYTKELKVGLMTLAILALVPIIFRRWRNR